VWMEMLMQMWRTESELDGGSLPIEIDY